MSNDRLVLSYAKYLNKTTNKKEIRKYYKEQASMLKEDVYNLMVTLLSMCINKELSIVLTADKETGVEDFPEKIRMVYKDVNNAYTECNRVVVESLQYAGEDKSDALEYLNNLVKVLLSGINYIEKKADAPWDQSDEHNEWNTRFRREERVRDNMKKLISIDGKYTKFTIKHKIEIPSMYVLAWDLPTLFRTFDKECVIDENDKSYIGNLRKNTSITLRYISDNMLTILLYGEEKDPEEFDNIDDIVRFRKIINFRELLPTIEICEKVDYSNDLHDGSAWAKARKTHKVPLVKSDVLRRIPLIPMESEENNYSPVKSLMMMVELLREENKTKDYLASDFVCLMNSVGELCNMILNWIWNKENEKILFRIEEPDAQEYLISIIKAVNNVPRKNTTNNRQSYINNIINVVAKMWDRKNLKGVSVDNNYIDTYAQYAYFSVLKLARNWNEHNLIKNPSITFAVFLIMVSLRYVIEIDKLDIKKYTKYISKESELLDFFKKGDIEYKKLKVNEELEKEYLTMYETVKSFVENDKNKRFPKDNNIRDPHQVLNVAGYEDSLICERMSEYEIYLTFWLSIHYGANSGFVNFANSQDMILIELLKKTYNYQKLSFLLENN